MLYFIPAWYQQNNWCENEQYWYRRRLKTEFDDTVKHIQLFHRSQAYPFQIMLLSFAPNFRHFLHRQGVFRAPYWSCFDAIQEIRKKKTRVFSFHNLSWPEHIEFIYSPFALIALLGGHKYAQVEFGEDGNPIQVDLFKNEQIQRRNIYDDRGFVSSTIIYEDGKPVHQDYLTEKAVWKIRHFHKDGHVEVNPNSSTYLLEYQGQEYTKNFTYMSYNSLDEVIFEVVTSYLELIDKDALFCVAMHELHEELVKTVLYDRKKILSFFENRYDVRRHKKGIGLVEKADYIITDSQENLKIIKKESIKQFANITDITPFDSRVDFGISQQLSVQKILVPVDGMNDDKFEELIVCLGEYLSTNDSAQIHLFTRAADYDKKKQLLKHTRQCLRHAGMEVDWAAEENAKSIAENRLDEENAVPVRFFVEQCVDELAVSKCMREQRLIVDMRSTAELYLRITGLSVGIPQIVSKNTQFVENGKNGLVLKNMEKLSEAIAYYLDNLSNWNEAMVHSYELGKKYTTNELIEKWKEVIDSIGCDKDTTTRE